MVLQSTLIALTARKALVLVTALVTGMGVTAWPQDKHSTWTRSASVPAGRASTGSLSRPETPVGTICSRWPARAEIGHDPI